MVTSSTPQPGRIMVVDDESTIREVCRRTLTAPGYQVVTATNGDEALAIMDNSEFDIVLSDIMMPGSLELTLLLEAIKMKSPDTDVVMMTGFPSLDTAIPTLKRGAYDYLVKPFDNAVLLSVINRCFEKRRLREELDKEKILRLELKAAYAELQKVEKLKESFLSRLSHELRTPFVSVFFVLDEIESDPANQPIFDVIKTLRARITEVWGLVENMLLFADLKHEHVNAYKIPIEPKALLQQLIETYAVAWESKKISVRLSVANDVESILGDPQLLGTAFKHLLLNAVQFNKKGGEIAISVKRQGGMLVVTFADTGVGIPEDKMAGVFDSFYQVAEYMTRDVGGLGLGLAIVRRIIEAHGGTISVASLVGEGSQFMVLLPAGKGSDDDA